MIFLYIIVGVVLLVILFLFGLLISDKIKYPPLRPKEIGFEYVHIDYDGSVRELYPEEKEHLTRKYEGADGNRPYKVDTYGQKSPDGKISGYILRRRVPANITIITRARGY